MTAVEAVTTAEVAAMTAAGMTAVETGVLAATTAALAMRRLLPQRHRLRLLHRTQILRCSSRGAAKAASSTTPILEESDF